MRLKNKANAAMHKSEKALAGVYLTLFVMGCVALSGCVQIVTAGLTWNVVSALSDNGKKNEYVSGKKYKVIESVFVMTNKRQQLEKKGELVAPKWMRRGMASIRLAPESVNCWTIHSDDILLQEDADSYFVAGVLDVGDEVLVTGELAEHSISFWFGYGVFRQPIAVVMGGGFDGWTVVLSDISVWDAGRRYVDDRILKEITDK